MNGDDGLRIGAFDSDHRRYVKSTRFKRREQAKLLEKVKAGAFDIEAGNGPMAAASLRKRGATK